MAKQISDGILKRTDIPFGAAEAMRQLPDELVPSSVKTQLGMSSHLESTDFSRQIKSLRKTLMKGTGNPYAGEATFMQRCAACHKLLHKGGNIGPDLTPYQRENLDTLLISVINPNAEIREGFEYVTLQTRDGRTLKGFLTDQDNQILAIRGMTGEDIRVERKDVLSLEPMGRSLMPEGLLEDLTEQNLRDFFAYLKISQPISN